MHEKRLPLAMKYLLLHLFLLVTISLAAQSSSEIKKTNGKDTAPDFVHMMQKRGHDEAITSIETYNRGKISVHQRVILEQSKRLNQQIKLYLKSGEDTTAFNQLLERTKAAINIVKDGVFINKGSNQTQRNLIVSSNILTELSERLERQKNLLDVYANQLIDFRVKIDSLQGDSLVYSFDADSLKIANYIKRLVVIVKELSPVDSSLNKALASTEALQVKVDLTVFELRSLKEDIDIYSFQLSNKSLTREFPYLWEKPIFSRPFSEIVRLSRGKEYIVLQYYFQENWLTLVLLFISLCGSFFFLLSVKQQLKNDDNLHADFSDQLVVRYPLLSAILFVLCIFQFVFSDPPFIIYFLIWLMSAICLLFIFNKYITGYWMQFWIVIVCLFVLAGIDNMILQTSRMERFFNLLLSTAGIAYTAFILANRHRDELKEKNIPYFINFVLVCQILSFFLNLFGRFNLSKAFMVTGYSGVVIAITFLWVVRGINNGLALASSVYKHQTRRLFFINFDRVGKEIPPVFYVVLVAGWFFLVGKNFYALKQLYDSFLTMLIQQRVVGNYTFSIRGMLVFLLILVSSMFLSKLVSFFGSEQVGTGLTEKDKKKFKLGSYLLLVRIFIISMGLFFAFVAAGISLDKLTIVLGALSVGIGLGLQGLVSNLVSGLILSFERPVNVGDLIEVNGKMGTMKSIGFRSSVIASADGSCIIIPNGELLNQHMVNWTMGKNLKRNNFILAVAFGTDLQKVKMLVMKLLKEDDRILHYPAPDVYIKDIGQNAFQAEVVFWPKHIGLSATVKSDLIAKIDAVFKMEGIIIPIPQQDLFIHAVPSPASEK